MKELDNFILQHCAPMKQASSVAQRRYSDDAGAGLPGAISSNSLMMLSIPIK